MVSRAIKVAAVLMAMIGMSQSVSYAALPASALRARQKQGKVLVVATNATLADIAHYVGGKRVYVTSLTDDFPPQSEPKVEYRSVRDALREANIVLRLGDSYDPWIHSLVRVSGNTSVAAGQSGDVDASLGIAGLVDSACGHASYYWLDPENAKSIASTILNALEKSNPGQASYFRSNYEMFCRKIDEKLAGWQRALAADKGVKGIVSCDAWKSFERRFGIEGVGALQSIRTTSTDSEHVCQMAGQVPIGSSTVELPTSVRSERGLRDYFEVIDVLVARVAGADSFRQ